VLVHQLRSSNIQLNILAVYAIWGLSTSAATRKKLVDLDIVELLYKLLNLALSQKIITQREQVLIVQRHIH
jgi:hypothetical protein